MARQQQRLTALQVNKLTKPGLHGDGGGLTLQITPMGAKSWLFRYMIAGKSFGMGLGPLDYPQFMSLPRGLLQLSWLRSVPPVVLPRWFLHLALRRPCVRGIRRPAQLVAGLH
jgi:hypothetical protein